MAMPVPWILDYKAINIDALLRKRFGAAAAVKNAVEPRANLPFLAFVCGAISIECINADRGRSVSIAENRIEETLLGEDLPPSAPLKKLATIWGCRAPQAPLDSGTVDWKFFRFSPEEERLVRDWMKGEIDLVETNTAGA
jgi:hypothetical protein